MAIFACRCGGSLASMSSSFLAISWLLLVSNRPAFIKCLNLAEAAGPAIKPPLAA